MHIYHLPFAYDRHLPRRWRNQRIRGNAVPCLRLFGLWYLCNINSAWSIAG